MQNSKQGSGDQRAAAKVLKIGNAGGYWGDDPEALQRQLEGGPLDYVTMDFLAEVTMSILQKQRTRDPALGYARDFVPMLRPVLKRIVEQGTCVISNAGGVHPVGCAQAISKMAEDLGLADQLKIAVVQGDDILEQVPGLIEQGVSFVNMENGKSFEQVADRLEAANVYFGARAVTVALQRFRPHIIVTGRVTDTGITLAPMVDRFAWSWRDWDRLAAGIVAGHILECGSQATGGNFTDWKQVKSFDRIGYPIVEMEEDGSFIVTKHPGSGGLVSVDTVREQLFYEMGQPGIYITPDVIADFGSIRLESLGDQRVRVWGVRGYEPTPTYKVSMAYRDGYKTTGSIIVSGPQAKEKAKAFSDIFWQRCGEDIAESNRSTEYVGLNACQRSLGDLEDANEIVLRLAARGPDAEALLRLGKRVPALILSGPPGVAVLGGVEKPRGVVSYWPALMDKQLCHPDIGLWSHSDQKLVQMETIVDAALGELDVQTLKASKASKASGDATEEPKSPGRYAVDKADSSVAYAWFLSPEELPDEDWVEVRLSELCLARSGDKGDMANIGLLARTQALYDYLGGLITAQRVKNTFQELCLGKVERFDVPSMLGWNFLLHEALGGGGTLTMRVDAQGKTFAQALLAREVKVPKSLLPTQEDTARPWSPKKEA